MRGRKPKPTHLKLIEGNPGRRPINGAEPKPSNARPTCPAHLSPTAKAEWKRLAHDLNRVGLLTLADRAALAAYCQSYGRWVEAERRLAESPPMLKTPAGYVQQNPWMTVANKQLELMGRYMAELGLTPASRTRVVPGAAALPPRITVVTGVPRAGDPEPDAAFGRFVDLIDSQPAGRDPASYTDAELEAIIAARSPPRSEDTA